MKNSPFVHNEEDYSYIQDAKDMKIIKCLCDNARLPYSRIGRCTRISKDRVRERIKNLEKKLFILSYTPLINYEALSYKLYHVYLRFNKSLNSNDELIVKLKKNEKVVALTRIAGKWDLEIQILGKNKSEISELLARLQIKSGTETPKIEIIEARDMRLYSMRVEYFKLDKKIIKAEDFVPKSKPNVDALDLKILKVLATNAREKITDIASICKTKEDVVRYRIKSLIKNKIILGFYVRTNKHRFGLTSYILKLYLKNNPRQNDLISLEKLQNIYYMRSFKGRYNLLIGFSAKNNTELVDTLDFVKDCFGKNLINFELLILLDRYKFLVIS